MVFKGPACEWRNSFAEKPFTRIGRPHPGPGNKKSSGGQWDEQGRDFGKSLRARDVEQVRKYVHIL